MMINIVRGEKINGNKMEFSYYQRLVLKKLIEVMVEEFREIFGFAFRQYDCGCTRLFGVSSEGEKVSDTMHFEIQKPKEKDFSGCDLCAGIRGYSDTTTLNFGVMWGSDSEGDSIKHIKDLVFLKVWARPRSETEVMTI